MGGVAVCSGFCQDFFFPEKGRFALARMIAPGINCGNKEATLFQHVSLSCCFFFHFYKSIAQIERGNKMVQCDRFVI